jgi:hypothetical protein
MHPDGRRRELCSIASAHRSGLRKAHIFCAVHPHGSECVSASEDCIVTAAKMIISASKSFIPQQDFFCTNHAAHLFSHTNILRKSSIVRSRPRAYNAPFCISIARADSIFHIIADCIVMAVRLIVLKNTNYHELITNFS